MSEETPEAETSSESENEEAAETEAEEGGEG